MAVCMTFLALTLVAAALMIASAFTSKTGFFLKNKTKQKAILSYFGIAIVCMALTGLTARNTGADSVVGTPEAAVAAELPSHTSKITANVKGMKLSIDCVLSEGVDAATLEALGKKVYEENNGASYENVFIMWYLPHYKIGAGAWGTTNFQNGKINVRILRLQG